MNYQFVSLNNNINEYLECLTRTGPKRLHVLYKYILSKFSAYTHAHLDSRLLPQLTVFETSFPVAVEDQVSIFVSQETGKQLARLADQGVRVMMTITPGKKEDTDVHPHNSISKTSVLFVSISFIVLMIISLAWLVFYYIQRFRYAHAKERLAVSGCVDMLFKRIIIKKEKRIQGWCCFFLSVHNVSMLFVSVKGTAKFGLG